MRYVQLTSKNETANGGNESREKRVEWISADEHTISELQNSRQQNINEISVDQLELLWRGGLIFIVELGQYCLKLNHLELA
jgi:hypothetical protein